MAYKVKFVNPIHNYQMIKEELDAAYRAVMEKGDLIDRGQLRSFEENLAKFVGTRYAVGLNSGYDALHLSLRAAGIGPGDEVIVPAHTFVATCSAVVNVGATPVLVDVGKDFNIDCDLIEAVVSPRTRGIIPVHLSGFMADMVRVMELARRYDLVVVEDEFKYSGFGAKGVGEIAFIATPLAITNALYQAVGIRFHEIPLDMEKIYFALREKKSHGSRSQTLTED